MPQNMATTGKQNKQLKCYKKSTTRTHKKKTPEHATQSEQQQQQGVNVADRVKQGCSTGTC
eukprot:m.126383 g.126383  ORF g.126383 m.126383 type:complete len:61 (+) comp15640_c1_seq1:242-424(+)